MTKGKPYTGSRILVDPRPSPWGRRVAPGRLLLVQLEEDVSDHVGRNWPGPHSVGRAEVLPDGRLALALIEATRAGQWAKALLEDDLLDVVFFGSQPVVRLRA